jgi:hypothetical protein
MNDGPLAATAAQPLVAFYGDHGLQASLAKSDASLRRFRVV